MRAVLFSLRRNKLIIFSLLVLWANYTLAKSEDGMVISRRIDSVSYFVNRQTELTTISQNLQSYKITSIVGISGIGKTELARKYALTKSDEYDLIWFIDSSLDLNEQFLSLAKQINSKLLGKSNQKIAENLENSMQEVMQFLSTTKRWLLVFDNLRLGQNSKLNNIIDWSHNGHVIICSQDSTNLPHIVYLHRLEEHNATELLRKILNSDDTDSDIFKALIEIYNGYPAPIVRGAILMKEHKYLTLDEYKAILEKSDNPVKSHMKLILELLDHEDKRLLYYIVLLNNQEFSKNFLQMLFNKKDKVGEHLYNLYKFGLIKNIEHNNNFFEMHDSVKDSILEILSEDEIRDNLAVIIDSINKLMPQGVCSRYSFITSDDTIKSNLEVLLENAEKYKVDIYKILQLRKNLSSYYSAIGNHYNWEKMKKWLEQKEKNKILQIGKMKNENIVNYSWYLVDCGIFEEFVKADYISALDFYDKAAAVIGNINDEPELKATIFWQRAQTYIYRGDISSAEKNILASEEIINNFPKADLDIGLYWFIKARILLAKGKYIEALKLVDINIKQDAHLPRDTFTAPTFILKSEILNYMARYRESNDVISAIYSQEIGDKVPESELHGRILVQLSRAKLGLGNIDEAFKYAKIACSLFEKDIHKYNIKTVLNTEYAAALVAKANALVAKKDYVSALESYNEAEIIYFRKYGENYFNMDDILYLLTQGMKTACLDQNTFWKDHFYLGLMRFSEDSNPRIKDTIKFCKTLGF